MGQLVGQTAGGERLVVGVGVEEITDTDIIVNLEHEMSTLARYMVPAGALAQQRL